MAREKWRSWLVGLLILCGGIILTGGIRYVSSLREGLTDQAVGNVLTVTRQQQQAFDNFISGDRERLHSYARYFARNSSRDTEVIQDQLKVFDGVDASYAVIDLSNGKVYDSKSDGVFRLGGQEFDTYRDLSGSGVRDPFTGFDGGTTMFGYYECFTFADGVPGLIQKSYDSSKVSNDFSLSFYNDRGLAYVVNLEGDILLRSKGMLGDRLYGSIFDVLTGFHGGQQNVDGLKDAFAAREMGSMVLDGDKGSFVYTYVPVENMEEWFLVSIVPKSAITEETDQILMDSQVTLTLLSAVLIVCAIFVLLIWSTSKSIAQKEREVRYQEELFNIFSTHLSNNTNDVYMMMDLKRKRTEYVSPNVERVLGIPAEKISADVRSFAGTGGAGGEKLDADEVYAMEPGDSLAPITTSWINPKTKEYQWFQVNFLLYGGPK